MSKQRQRDRAAREAAAAQEAAAAARRRPKAPARPSRPAARRPAAPRKQPVYRQRRFPPLPWRLKLALALGWLTVAVLSLVLVPTWTGRLGVLVLATFCLPLIVVIVRDPTRRTSR